MKFDSNGLISGTRDIAFTTGIYCFALWHESKWDALKAKALFHPVEKILFRSTLWPIKDPTYFWHNSDGITLFIGKILHRFKIAVRKGTNPDQTMPCLIYAALSGNKKFLKKFLLGMILRIGFYPNGEHILFKLHHLSPVMRGFKIHWLLWVTDFWFYVSICFDSKLSISQSTTNKIRAYLFLVQAEGSPTIWTKKAKIKLLKAARPFEIYTLWFYFKLAYKTYFKKESLIYQTMKYNLLSQ